MPRVRTGCNGCGCLTIFITTFLGITLLRHPVGGLVGFVGGLILLRLLSINRSGTKGWDRVDTNRDLKDIFRQRGGGKSAGGTDNIDLLLALHMAVIRQNPAQTRDIHRQTALQLLHNYARQLNMSYSSLTQRFQEWGEREINVRQMANRASEAFPPQLLQALLRDLILVGFADGQLSEDETGMLKFIGRQFGFADSEISQLINRVKQQFKGASGTRGKTASQTGTDLEQAYETLDLSPSATMEEVEKQYKELARKYHPDRFKDDSEEARELAEEKMMEVNRAYKQIKEHG